jgi:hypothetical protein
MTTLHIDSIKPTAKSLVLTCAGKEYFAKKDSGLDGKVGSTIEVETKASDYNGKSYVWIEKWKTAPNGAAAAPAQGSFTASGVNLAFLPFVSNIVAHAIQAGYIQMPADIQKWASTAYSVAHDLKAGPDDDIPY